MPRDAVSRTANVERNGGHKWVNNVQFFQRSLGQHMLIASLFWLTVRFAWVGILNSRPLGSREALVNVIEFFLWAIFLWAYF